MAKSVIYNGPANDPSTVKTYSANYRAEAFNALQKFSESDPPDLLIGEAKYGDVSR